MEICSDFGFSPVSVRKQLLLVIEKFFPCLGREFLVLGLIMINVIDRLSGYGKIDPLSTIASTGQASWQKPQ
jgi:hypothetical protein